MTSYFLILKLTPEPSPLGICYGPQMLHLLEVSLVLCLVSISGEGWAKNCHQKCGISTLSQVFLGNIAHGVMSVL